MKTQSPSNDHQRFHAQLRHYHRVDTRPAHDWHSFIHGSRTAQLHRSPARRSRRKWQLILGVISVFGALGVWIASWLMQAN